jgi:1,4-alpha-glucan branching enzyme
VIIFRRWKDGGCGDKIVVVMNFSSQAYEDYHFRLATNCTYDLVFNSDAKMYDNEFSNIDASMSNIIEGEWDSRSFSSSITIPPYTTLIFATK